MDYENEAIRGPLAKDPPFSSRGTSPLDGRTSETRPRRYCSSLAIKTR